MIVRLFLTEQAITKLSLQAQVLLENPFHSLTQLEARELKVSAGECKHLSDVGHCRLKASKCVRLEVA